MFTLQSAYMYFSENRVFDTTIKGLRGNPPLNAVGAI